jgi:hypothetical protein
VLLEGGVNRFPPRPSPDRAPTANTPAHRGELRRRKPLAAAAALVLTACPSLAACSSQGVSGTTPANSAAKGPRITVAMVTHGQSFDPFWALVLKGA